MNRTVLLSLLILALLLVGASCGGNAGTTQLDSAKDVQGITEGGFNLIRYDDSGNATNKLNPTLDLAVQSAADTTTVTIRIDDKQPTLGVNLDLHYDSSKYTPADVQFGGLIDTDVELAVTRIGGLVAIGQVSTTGAAQHAGQFATVTFRNEPNRTISAAGDAADKPINSTYSANGFTADGFTVAGDGGGGLVLDILGIFTSLSGDGDQNGASNIGDLTPLGALLAKQVTTTDAVSARADYDGNGLPNISDLTPLGANLGEATTGIEILAGDSAGTATTVVKTLDWNTDGDAPVAPNVVTGDPFDVWRQFSTTVDATAMAGIDANADGHVFVTAQAVTSGAGNDAAPFSPPIDVTVGTGSPGNPSFQITSVDLQVGGTTINNGDTLNLLHANDRITIEVTSFGGTFDGNSFTPGTLDGTTTPTDTQYQEELAIIQEDVDIISQTLNPTSVADFQTDKSGVILNFQHHGNGHAPAQPATGDIFPDDDPGNAAEGEVEFGFSNSNNHVTAMTVTVDVQDDSSAPLIDDIKSGAGQDLNGSWMITNTSPDILGHLTFPGGDPTPVDGTTVDVELVDLTNHLVLPVDFVYSATPPTAAAKFTLIPAVTGFDFQVRVPAGLLNDSTLYMVRFFSPPTEHGSSVNKPGQFLAGGAVPIGFNSKVLPSQAFDGDTNIIAFIPEDPQIRRNPQIDVNQLDQTTTPHYGGYSDLLKDNGNFFTLAVSNSTTYPQVVIVQANDPSAILSTAVPDLTIIQTETNPHRIVVDIQALDDTATATWAYKVFGAPVISGDLSSRPVVTSGTFVMNPPAGPDPANITGVNFGVNVYDSGINEGVLTLGSEDWSNKVLSLSSTPTTYGDGGNAISALFVEFNGGDIVPQAYPLDNTHEGYSAAASNLLILNNTTTSLDIPAKVIDVRVAGVGTGSLNYIGVVHFDASDQGAFGLVAGFDYEVKLKDPSVPSMPVFSFGNGAADPKLSVSL